MICNRTSKGVYKITIPTLLAGRISSGSIAEYMVTLTPTGVSLQNNHFHVPSPYLIHT